ncbi:uncharacterized protein LOC123532797 [Mercenaria mercenaria]|uniref:uncharacterized protein LOC123532797 n=1 Tax=Mercenaria mercenaria TaxID=6596 RepID=UPI00234F5C44|nr:uncharacterized protein LOC123532797 [Mercenaria mercenaria]
MFIDYRPEVKHFSRCGLVDDSDEEDIPDTRTGQDKKRLHLAQQQQMADRQFNVCKETRAADWITITETTGSPLLRQGDGPSLFSSSLKSKYMSPVKIANIPQKETTKDRGKQSLLSGYSCCW